MSGSASLIIPIIQTYDPRLPSSIIKAWKCFFLFNFFFSLPLGYILACRHFSCVSIAHIIISQPHPASFDSTPDTLGRILNIARCLLMLPWFLIKKSFLTGLVASCTAQIPLGRYYP